MLLSVFFSGWLFCLWQLWRSMDELRVEAKVAYKDLPLREQFWFLWHVDHKGRNTLYNFSAAITAFMFYPHLWQWNHGAALILAGLSTKMAFYL